MKLFKKLAIAVVGAVMALGVGIGVNAGAKGVPARAGDSYTYSFDFSNKPAGSGTTKFGDVSWNVDKATALGNYNSGNYKGVQIGSNGNSGEYKISTKYAWGNEPGTNAFGSTSITSIDLYMNHGGGTMGATVTIGGVAASSSGSVSKNSSATSNRVGTSKVTYTPASNSSSGIVSIDFVSTSKAGYICAMDIICSSSSGDLETYNVSFNCGEGSGEMDDDTTTGSYLLPESTFTAPSGKEFSYWTIGTAGAGTHYLPGEIVDVSADITFVANYEDSFTGTLFDLTKIDGFSSWSSSYSQHIVEYDQAVLTFDSADRQSSTITDMPVIKGTAVTFSTVDRPNLKIKSIQWDFKQWSDKAQTVTLNYSTDGTNFSSTGISSSKFTVKATSLPEGTVAVRVTFSTTNNIGVKAIIANFSGSLAAKTYTVTYNANNGTGTAPVDSSEYESGDTVTVLGQGSLENDVLSFDGWNTKADGTGTSYEEGDTFSITSDVTLYAQWKYAYAHAGTEADPFGAKDAYYKALEVGTSTTTDYYYIKGTVSEFVDTFNPSYGNYSFNIVEDGKTFECYRGLDGRENLGSPAKFTTGNEIEIGDVVTFRGKITYYADKSIAETAKDTCAITDIEKTVLELSSVEITGNMSKTSYYTTDNWDVSGLIVTAYFANSTNANVTNKVEWSFTPSKPDDISITTVTIEASFTSNGVTKTDSINIDVTVSVAPTTVTIDLTVDDTTSASDDALTWDNSVCYVECSRGTNTNQGATSYYPGSSTPRTSTRFYKNFVVTFSPKSGMEIVSLEFNATTDSYASTFAGSTFTNASQDTNVNVVTLTPTNGTNDIVIVIGGTCGFESIVITYTASSSPSDEADDWATGFISNLTCDNGVTAPNKTVWSAQATAFAALSDDAKAILRTATYTIAADGITVTPGTNVSQKVAEAVARYVYIVEKYGTANYNDFMGRNIQSSARTTVVDSSATMMVTVISLVSVSTIAGYFFLRKKKQTF